MMIRPNPQVRMCHLVALGRFLAVISRIESALVKRLERGLGKLAVVTAYQGELDYEGGLGRIVRTLPAVWVSFAGITETKPVSVSRTTQKARAMFSVLVAARDLRSDVQRQGKKRKGKTVDVGAYDLIYAVRRLLSNQDCSEVDESINIDRLQPGRVRLIANTKLETHAIVVYSCEFVTSFIEHELDIGRYPSPVYNDKTGEPSNVDDCDNIFIDAGEHSPPDPVIDQVDLNFFNKPATTGDPSIVGRVLFNKDE